MRAPRLLLIGLALLLLLLGLALGMRALYGPARPTAASRWVNTGPLQLRVDRVSTFTLEQYRSYHLPPTWLLRLTERIPGFSNLNPPLNGVQPPPYQHETVILEASIQGIPLPQAQDLAFFLEVDGAQIKNDGHSWVEEPGKLLRLQSEFYIPEGTRPSAVIIAVNGRLHRFPITFR